MTKNLTHHYGAAKALLDYFNTRCLTAEQANTVIDWMWEQLLANVRVKDNPDGILTFNRPLQSSYVASPNREEDNTQVEAAQGHGGHDTSEFTYNTSEWLEWAESNDLPPGLYEYLVVKARSDEPDYGGFPEPRPFPAPDKEDLRRTVSEGPKEGDRWEDTNEGWVKVYRDGAWQLETPHDEENMSDRIKALEIQITSIATAVGALLRANPEVARRVVTTGED